MLYLIDADSLSLTTSLIEALGCQLAIAPRQAEVWMHEREVRQPLSALPGECSSPFMTCASQQHLAEQEGHKTSRQRQSLSELDMLLMIMEGNGVVASYEVGRQLQSIERVSHQ